MDGMSGGRSVIGRDDELAAIDAFLTMAARQPCGLVLSGELGIGKTVLWETAVARAVDRGGTVLLHRGVQAEAEFAFAGLSDLVAPVLDAVADVLAPPRRRALEVALLLADAPTAPDPRAIGLAFLDVLGELARTGPLLVALDDIQWLDASSAHVLPVALRRLRDEGVGVIATVREAPGSREAFRLEEALSGHPVQRLSLGPLPPGELHRLLREHLGVEFRRPELTAIARASAGNPFYALELGATAGRAEPGRAMVVPESLRQLLGSRLERLSEQTKDLLLEAAALARPAVGVLSAGRDDPALAVDALQVAVSEGVVVLEGGRVRFAHPLLASLCYEEALPSRRRAAHRRLARVVDDPEERARHLALASQGPDPSVAAELDAAAAHAEARGATVAAADLARLAVERTPPELVDQHRHRRLKAALLCRFAGDFDGACAMYQTLLAELPAGTTRARVRYAVASIARITLPERIRLSEQALAEADGDAACQAQVLGFLGHSRWLLGQVPVALQNSRAGLRAAESTDDPHVLASALARTACLETFALDPTPGLLRRALEVDRTLDGPVAWHENPTFMLTVAVMHGRDELELARDMLVEVETAAVDRGDEDTRPWVALQSIVLEWYAGRWHEALRHAAVARELARELGQVHYQVMVARFTALVLAGLGHVEQCRATAREGLRLARSIDDERMVIGTLAALGHLELALGDLTRADRRLRDLPDRLLRTGHRNPVNGPWADAVETSIALGDLERARRSLDTFRALARDANGWARIGAARCTGLLAAAQGETDAAVRVLEAALESDAAAVYPFERGRTLLALGTARRQVRHSRAARETLEQAVAVFQELDASLWLDRASAELRRVSGRRPLAGQLTETERRVAELAAKGRRNKEIAAELFLSVGTVESYLSRIYRKLAVRSRTELARRLGPGSTGRDIPNV
jgi:DNA-binding CsgD family transcriptional regulator